MHNLSQTVSIIVLRQMMSLGHYRSESQKRNSVLKQKYIKVPQQSFFNHLLFFLTKKLFESCFHFGLMIFFKDINMTKILRQGIGM